MKTLPVNGKIVKHLRLKFNYLNFTIKVFVWGLANDHAYIKKWKLAKHITLYNLVWEIIQYQICKCNRIMFQNSFTYYEAKFYRYAAYLLLLVTYFWPNSISFENQILPQFKQWLKRCLQIQKGPFQKQ